jgi:hypothetical protein
MVRVPKSSPVTIGTLVAVSPARTRRVAASRWSIGSSVERVTITKIAAATPTVSRPIPTTRLRRAGPLAATSAKAPTMRALNNVTAGSGASAFVRTDQTPPGGSKSGGR